MGYAWVNNNACKATYQVLTHPHLNQLRPDAVPFEDAGSRTMGSLPFFNHTASGSLRLKLARIRATEFLVYLQDVHPLVKEDPNQSTLAIYDALASILSSEGKTVADLAGAVDGVIQFPDEA